MDYKYLNYCSPEELYGLKNIVENSSVKDINLLISINKLLEKQKENLDYDFSSDNIPYYKKELEEKCDSILKQLDFSKIFFFMASFCEKGNGGSFCNPNVTYDLMKYYADSVAVFRNLAENSWGLRFELILYEEYIYLNQIDNMFKNDYYKQHYEGSYNMLNYIKNYIYFMLDKYGDIDLNNLYQEYCLKKSLIVKNLNDICDYLNQIRQNTNLRSSLSNYGLSRNAKKTSEQLTLSQTILVDALAFGTTVDKIEDKDYSDFRKILYLPRGKQLRK